MAKSLNRVQLIGNLTRDPELRYTPNGTAVCSFGLATNRTWTTEQGEKHEEAEFHNIVAWNKLAELCSQFLTKGRKVYLEGRLSTRSWQAQDGTQKNRTEIIISDMILLDSKRPDTAEAPVHHVEEDIPVEEAKPATKTSTKAKPDTAEAKPAPVEQSSDEEVAPDDIPF
ncbi:MAG TPA: single-stranded DNA-binding protein [Candidatus Saccharimonadales bacterium]|nr:single-stranded DNA-binding protein [Candidatus Saccharimonadales bacterium]